jgi:N-acetylglucosaminylphosphatidylinositol deacetylase
VYLWTFLILKCAILFAGANSKGLLVFHSFIMLSVVLSLTCIVSLLAYAYASIAQFQKLLPFTTNNVLILIAHPDDECMFFGPTITSLRTLTKSRVHVLCLSTGNADGLGSLRKKELVKSCQILGVPASNVKSLENPYVREKL